MKTHMFHVLLFFSLAKSAVVPSVPSHLRDCYRSSLADSQAPRRLDVYLSLLRKLELNNQLDMRMFSTALLRSLRLDGIEQSSANAVETEFLLPYRASSFQFHKYKLLMDIFLPSQNLINVDETLPVEEKCLLHEMLSSTVRRWERGDENVVCPVSAQQSQTMVTQSSTRINSRCPIEEGVIQTNWGTVSPGTLVAAIATSLEPQRVSVTDILNANIFKQDIAEPMMSSAKQEWFENIETLPNDQGNRWQSDIPEISNIWVATLAGDLAEVVVNQGPRVGAVAQNMSIGTNSRWNDTLLPRHHYIFPPDGSIIDWHFTDAEMLAGIDGLILAQYVPKWVEQRRTLRLSQVLDMYYSNDGVSFEPTVRACNRRTLFNNLFNSTDLVTEASKFAYVLSLRQITVYMPVQEMERITNAAVTAFDNYLSAFLRQNHNECRVSNSVPVIDLIVATDGSWKGNDVEEFMSWMGGALESSLQRGTMSLLHGNSGQWIAPPSHNLTTVFSHIKNYTDQWPNRLNLPTVMSSVLRHSLNSSLMEIANNASGALSTIVLIISPSDRPSATEMEQARSLMSSLRTTYFDVYFTYVAENLSDFQVISEYMDYSELFLRTPSTRVQNVIDAVDDFLLKNHIPSRLIGPQCPFNNTVFKQVEYEDFVLPNRPMYYRIHPFYLQQQPLIQVQFRNSGQGELLVCMWRGAEASHSCQTIEERGTHAFNLTNPCPSPDFCLPAHFTVAATSSSNTCAHNDCRLPHEVGYYITHTGLRCLPLRALGRILQSELSVIVSALLILKSIIYIL
ncbi:unnamed protein product [Arctia plantaginis]|uniref:Uncharacterized protein n=1 Tax=Arctia plantaginis TaxID=874455 RepID=A0A8S1A261_ARCPL|nr:unnamed protein product [Arctia plantaginis]CAB3240557.1 unnamed protein product [Arctia plantaginis]